MYLKDMKYLKLFENYNKEDIDSICEEYDIKIYDINNDGSIDVNDSVYLHSKRLSKLPLKFNRINGYFNCSHNNLTSLEGCPKEVGGYFDCSNNQLVSLEDAPQKVLGDFICDPITLRGCPDNLLNKLFIGEISIRMIGYLATIIKNFEPESYLKKMI